MKLERLLFYKKMKRKNTKGFTLVELLIVIALIAILSVAVLATINPIEQANKARDSSTQNDAAEVLNGYERYYANQQFYPWMRYDNAGTAMTVDDVGVFRSDMGGFGICYADIAGGPTDDGVCNTTGDMGLLIESDELKPSFANKSAFSEVDAYPQNGLWTFKEAGSGGSIYVCYVPKAKVNRQVTEKLYCLDSTNLEIGKVGTTLTAGLCEALDVTDAGWSTPALDGVTGMFRCVPE